MASKKFNVFIGIVQNDFEHERAVQVEYLKSDVLLLANCLFLTGAIERYGTGTVEMIRNSKAFGLPEPTFTFQKIFKVILWRKQVERIGSDKTGAWKILKRGRIR